MATSTYVCQQKRATSRKSGCIFRPLLPPHAASTKIIAQDHASGALLVAEAGGKVTDMNGRDLDFSKGRTLKENKGVIAASKELHGEVLAAVQKAVAEERK